MPAFFMGVTKAQRIPETVCASRTGHGATPRFKLTGAGPILGGFPKDIRPSTMTLPSYPDMAAALEQAMERNELSLHFQPKGDLHNGHVGGVEALLRWHREGTLIQPAHFIPAAEATGQIIGIGSRVIDMACAHLKRWSADGLAETRLAVNVSALQLHAGNLDQVVGEALSRHGVAPERLELELTESMLMDDPLLGTERLRRLKDLGVHLSLDDFGTGYSCFAYLSRFPIDTLKVDQSFVRGMVDNANTASIVAAILGLARRLRLHTVAEGVETLAQLAYLRRLGSDEIQGYLFSRPLPEAEFLAFMRSDPRLPASEGESDARTLLLVDDEPGILAALKRMLRREGYRILTAASGAEALELLALESVQVMISDQRMPGMSGTELLTRVKDMHPHCLRVILSGQADMMSVLDAINDGAVYKFFTKPWDDAQLRERIREAFRVQAALHPGSGS